MTANYNFLQNNGFIFSLERIPQTIFRVTSCGVPSLSIPAPQAGFPGATQYFPGTNAEFEELTLQFLVDENLENYEEIYDWITQQRYCSNYVPKGDNDKLLVSDGTLVTMTNASNPNRVFKFKALFPIALGNLQFNTTITETQPVICQVTFKYSYFELVRKT